VFFRKKVAGHITYLQIAESFREDGKPRQRVLATLGRLDDLATQGKLDSLLMSGAKFSEKVMVLSAHGKGEIPQVDGWRIGAPMVFSRLWEETGCKAAIGETLKGRRFSFDVERAIFLTVLHRLVVSGSDRSADYWKSGYRIPGAGGLALHHAYRAMGFLGKPLPADQQEAQPGLAPRCCKDLIEEALFERRRRLYASLSLAFFDTTTLYFEGRGGQSIGKRGFSKDHRPDLPQMVAGVVMDQDARPICCEMWPGNTADVKTLLPVLNRMRERFRIGRVCIVSDRGMICEETLLELEKLHPEVQFILGARMRLVKVVKEEVLSRAGRYHEVAREDVEWDRAPLKVKGVKAGGRRYVVCLNEDEAARDRTEREAILEGLQKALKAGDKSLVGNKGFRKYLKAPAGNAFEIDWEKAKAEERYDGKYVLVTNTGFTAEEVALQYKQLWDVENIFRTAKSILETRPIYHKVDDTIRGHVFCSFLALVLRKALMDRLERKGHRLEWARVISDLEALEETELTYQGKRFILRREARGACGKVFQAAGVAMPPNIRQVDMHSVTPGDPA